MQDNHPCWRMQTYLPEQSIKDNSSFLQISNIIRRQRSQFKSIVFYSLQKFTYYAYNWSTFPATWYTDTYFYEVPSSLRIFCFVSVEMWQYITFLLITKFSYKVLFLHTKNPFQLPPPKNLHYSCRAQIMFLKILCSR